MNMNDIEMTETEPENGAPGFVPAVEHAAKKVADVANDAVVTATRSVKERPWVTFGIVLASGVFLGAFGYRLFSHQPTAREMLMKAFKSAGRVII